MNTHTAASANLSDVQAKVSIAVNGDTVNVPAGTATWASTLNVGSKAISIIGAGHDKTIITTGGKALQWSNTGANFFRLSGFGFKGVDNTPCVVGIAGPATKWRVDNCSFDKGDSAVGANFWLGGSSGTGPVYGVIDHCKMVNMKRAHFCMDSRNNDGGTAAWAELILEPGTEKMVYVEDCQFVWNMSMTDTFAQGAVYGSNGGGKCCFRYNTCEGYQFYIDAHGDNPDLGTMYYEIYRNTFTESNQHGVQGEIFFLRGGTHFVHNNIFNGPSIPVSLTWYWTYDVHVIGWQNKDSFFWGNTWNGNTNQGQLVHVKDSGQTPPGWSAARIRVGQEYWLAAPVSGQFGYPYKEFTYPHPLISGAPEPPVPIEPPLMPGLSFEAEAGAVDAPYTVANGLVSQNVVTTNPADGGRIRWKVTIPTAGDYTVKAKVGAADSGADSLFMSFDTEPVTADQWTVTPFTTGIEERANPKVWNLTAGVHTLYARGRETGCALDSITIVPENDEPPPISGPILISDVEGLQEALDQLQESLDGKAPIDHQHTIPESQTTS